MTKFQVASSLTVVIFVVSLCAEDPDIFALCLLCQLPLERMRPPTRSLQLATAPQQCSKAAHVDKTGLLHHNTRTSARGFHHIKAALCLTVNESWTM